VNERERERESADRTAAAPLRERFRGRGAGVLCFVLARAPHAVGRGTVRCRAGARRRWMERRRARTRVGRSRVACIGVCAVSARAGGGRESENLVKLRCSAAAVYERSRALYYAAVLPQCMSAAARSAPPRGATVQTNFKLLGDTGATFVGTYYCVPLTHGTECEYQPCVFLYRIVFMFVQDLICGFGLKNRFVFKKRRCLEHPGSP